MSAYAVEQFFHRPVHSIVRAPEQGGRLVSFIEDETDMDSYEAELKRRIELSGMVTPQYDGAGLDLESWD
jgi:hypothetical protein